MSVYPGNAVRATRDIRLPGVDNPNVYIVTGALGEVLFTSPRMVEYGTDGYDNAEVVVAFERGSVPAYADAAGPVVKVHVSSVERTEWPETIIDG